MCAQLLRVGWPSPARSLPGVGRCPRLRGGRPKVVADRAARHLPSPPCTGPRCVRRLVPVAVRGWIPAPQCGDPPSPGIARRSRRCSLTVGVRGSRQHSCPRLGAVAQPYSARARDRKQRANRARYAPAGAFRREPAFWARCPDVALLCDAPCVRVRSRTSCLHTCVCLCVDGYTNTGAYNYGCSQAHFRTPVGPTPHTCTHARQESANTAHVHTHTHDRIG